MEQFVVGRHMEGRDVIHRSPSTIQGDALAQRERGYIGGGEGMKEVVEGREVGIGRHVEGRDSSPSHCRTTTHNSAFCRGSTFLTTCLPRTCPHLAMAPASPPSAPPNPDPPATHHIAFCRGSIFWTASLLSGPNGTSAAALILRSASALNCREMRCT